VRYYEPRRRSVFGRCWPPRCGSPLGLEDLGAEVLNNAAILDLRVEPADERRGLERTLAAYAGQLAAR
jgi:hypothetical protein